MMTTPTCTFDLDAPSRPASPSLVREGPIIDRYVSSVNRLIVCATVGILVVAAGTISRIIMMHSETWNSRRLRT